jgi:hypothetical protein
MRTSNIQSLRLISSMQHVVLGCGSVIGSIIPSPVLGEHIEI